MLSFVSCVCTIALLYNFVNVLYMFVLQELVWPKIILWVMVIGDGMYYTYIMNNDNDRPPASSESCHGDEKQ